ncbi:MAG TPA: hypothetical protein VK438_07030 [Xanthobacteraceae bacterium]|nr:hypothetical protein [Xanthobacteraceae bacterium]
MSVSLESVRQFEQNLLQQTEVLALGLAGLRSADAARADQLLSQIIERLQGVVGHNEVAAGAERPRPFVVAARAPSDEVEAFILDILADSPRGLSVQDIVSRMDEAQLPMKRQTLVVRLHRMEHAGKLATIAHGHYGLSEAERSRRRS